MVKPFKIAAFIAVFLTCSSSVCLAETQAAQADTPLQPRLLLGIAAVILAAKLSGELFERIKQPAVLGELIAGIVLGNLFLFGFTAIEPLKTDPIIAALAQLGVILLLFEVGLQSNLKEMLEVGWSSLFVAIAGVVAPFALGWFVASYFLPQQSRVVHMFIASVLCATSVGITARVLKDLGKLSLRESRIILGAAVIDDVIGLMILAIAIGAATAAVGGIQLSTMPVVWIGLKAAAFFISAFLIGQYLIPHIFHGAGRFRSQGVLLILSIAFCFWLAWLADKVGLAMIVGAFAAGLVLDEAHFQIFRLRGERQLDELLAPVTTFLVPIFFVVMGMKVDLRVFRNVSLLAFAAALTLAAIIGKQICSLAVAERKLNRLAVGIGMIPRGEVGLIIAGIGGTLMLPDEFGVAQPVIASATFGAVVIMVIVTTLVTPPALAWALARKSRGMRE